MVRELAGWDPIRAQREVVRWPLREALLAYAERLKELAQARHDVAMQVWASIAPYAKKETGPPDVPAILKG
jgi:hypothetical protein